MAADAEDQGQSDQGQSDQGQSDQGQSDQGQSGRPVTPVGASGHVTPYDFFDPIAAARAFETATTTPDVLAASYRQRLDKAAPTRPGRHASGGSTRRARIAATMVVVAVTAVAAGVIVALRESGDHTGVPHAAASAMPPLVLPTDPPSNAGGPAVSASGAGGASGAPSSIGTPRMSASSIATPHPTTGAPQQQPVPAGPVTFDAAGNGSDEGSSLSWAQAVSGTNRLLIVAVAVGAIPDANCLLSVKDNGAAMTLLSTVHDNNQQAGFHSVFYRVAPGEGANTISASVSGCAVDVLTGGSMSFSGASQTSPLAAARTAVGSGAVAAVTVTGTRSGGMVAGFVSNGSSVDSARSPSTSRYILDGDDNTGAGNSAAVTQASSGGANTLAWSIQPDWWGATAVEVQPAGG